MFPPVQLLPLLLQLQLLLQSLGNYNRNVLLLLLVMLLRLVLAAASDEAMRSQIKALRVTRSGSLETRWLSPSWGAKGTNTVKGE